MTNRSFNYDEIYDSTGALLAPLGYGVSGDWELIDQVIVSGSVAAVPLGVDKFDPTLYSEIEIVIDEVRTATDLTALRVQVSDDNGATFEAGTGYAWDWHGSRDDAGTRLEGHNAADSSFELYNGIGNEANDNAFFKIRAGRMDNGVHKVFSFEGGRWDQAVSTNNVGFATFNGNTNDINAFQFFAGSGNIVGGRFYLRGRRKSPEHFGAPTDWEIIDSQDGLSAITTHDVFWADGVYDEIEITISGLVIGTDNTAVEMTLSTDGSTFHTGATDYEWMRVLAHSAGTNPATGGSTGDSKIELHHGAGTGTDEELDLKITFKNVSRTDKKKRCRIETEGNSADGLFRVNYGGGMLVVNNNSIRGFRIDPAGAVTFSADRIRVRGRRAITTQGLSTGGGDFVFMGDFGVASPGDAFINVDMRSSVNPQFADFLDHDFFVVVEGDIGPANSAYFFRILQDGVEQSGASDYKDDANTATSAIRLLRGTAGSGRRASTQFTVSGLNASTNKRVSLVGTGFSATSTGAVIALGIGGHNNGLAANTNNGMRILVLAGDMDDMRVKVWALRKTG